MAVVAQFRVAGGLRAAVHLSGDLTKANVLDPILCAVNSRFPKVARWRNGQSSQGLWWDQGRVRVGAQSKSALLAFLAALTATNICAHAAEPPQSDAQRQRFAMMDAAERGDTSAINRLINVGTKVDVRDESLRTPLYLAVVHNRIEAVKLLLSEGASVNAQARDLDTPWLLAGALGRAEILRLMIPHGPDLDIHNRFGGTALIPACEKGHAEAVRVLLDTAIKVDHVNNFGWTCLIEIAYLSDGGPRHLEVARMVLQAGANPDIADRKGKTALDHAEARKLTALAQLLRTHAIRLRAPRQK